MSWLDAQSHCRLYYTDLATVRDMKDLLRLRTAANGLTDLWTGLHLTSEHPNVWHWSQAALQYDEGESQWAVDQPDNDGNCVDSWVQDTWNDEHCDIVLNCSICYDEASSSPVMVSQSRDWLAAQQYCRSHYTDLVSGLDQYAQFLQTFPVRNASCWIGLSRDHWGWSDGSNSD
uniref:C-type lectin domain-containing protein n=1 Tax=Knipowitschia caucasica TaxID=637954 RepID=A0AAV2KLU2_KNICA